MVILNENNTSRPSPIVFTGFYRSGTSFFVEVLKTSTRAITEPLGYFTDLPHEELLTAEHYDESRFHPTFKGYDILFHQMFLYWMDSNSDTNKPILIKETEIAFRMSWLQEVLPMDTAILLVHRDPRAIIASFKRGNLHEQWQFDERFERLLETIRENKWLNAKYKAKFAETKPTDWISKLTVHYCIAMDLLEAAAKRWTGKVVEYTYENLMRNPHKEIKRIWKELGLKGSAEAIKKFESMSSDNCVSHKDEDPHAVFEKKVNIFEWQNILSDSEVRQIGDLVVSWDRAKDLIRVPEHLTNGVTGGSALPKRNGNSLKIGHINELCDNGTCSMSREEIIKQIRSRCLPLLCSTQISLERGIATMCAVHITNIQMASFLNWMKDYNVELAETRPNPFINDVKLSRIRRQTSNGNWIVKSGYENHPATYCTHFAFSCFAFWCGGRLPTVEEWELAASQDDPTQLYPWPLDKNGLDPKLVNYGGVIGKSTPVGYLAKNYNSSAQNFFCDLAGNVADWTSTVDFASLEAITKGGCYKDLEENLQIRTNSTRPIFLGAMSVGCRLIFDNQSKKPISDAEFLARMKELFTILNSSSYPSSRETARNIYTLLN
ncbi:sulfatase-modifying factor enzyme 1 domain-containing protein [Ditylenchus destructor]|nr:sulfatase-modifying factor enzyme 1 domain-containing protein [Ditylenchus destructor]